MRRAFLLRLAESPRLGPVFLAVVHFGELQLLSFGVWRFILHLLVFAAGNLWIILGCAFLFVLRTGVFESFADLDVDVY